MTWEPKLRSWQTCSWPTLLQVALLVPLSREWHMVGIPIKPHQGIGPIMSGGVQSSQLFDCFLHGRDPGLIRVDPYHRKAIYLSPTAPSSVKTRRKATSLWNFSASPQAFRLVREESSKWVIEAT